MTKRPRIALDLHTLAGLMQGSRTYAWNLAKRLPGLDPDSDFLFCIPRAYAEETSLLAAPNVRLCPIPASRLARLGTFGARLALAGAELLHCQYLAPPLLPCPSVLSLHDVLHESHPAYYPGGLRRLMKRLYPRAARRAALVLTCSAYSRREIIRRYGVPENRVETIPLAADEAFCPAQTPQQHEEATAVAARYGVHGRYILSVGRVEPKKNLSGLIRAFQALSDEDRHDVTLVIAGMADPIFCGRRDASPGGDDPRIAVIGEVPANDLAHLYRAATLFTFPSHAEGFGLPPLEAMASGVPVICSNATALPEVVDEAALLIAPEDTAGLARAMAQLLTDETLRTRLIAMGLQRSRRFSWETTARATLAAYHRVLARMRPAG